MCDFIKKLHCYFQRKKEFIINIDTEKEKITNPRKEGKKYKLPKPKRGLDRHEEDFSL